MKENQRRRSSKLSRAWGRTIGFTLIGLVCCVATFVTVKDSGPCWIVIVAGIFGFASFFHVLTACRRAICFACGKNLGRFYTFGYQRCPWCGLYGKKRGGTIYELEEDHVAIAPKFLIPVGSGLSLPDLCCACGGPATRTETVSRKRSSYLWATEL